MTLHISNEGRADLLGVGGRIAAQLHGPGAALERLDVSELDRRAMRRGFANWAADHSEGSLLRAWGVWNRFFAFLVDDELLVRNPMRAVPKPKLPQAAPRSIRHENPAGLLLETAAIPDPSAKAAKRWPERDVALLATFCVTGIRLAEAIALNLDSIPVRLARGACRSPARATRTARSRSSPRSRR